MTVAASICVALSQPALSQEYPSKPITLVVPNTAATTLDLIARLTGTELAKALNQSVIVENRTGAEGTIGMYYVAKQAPADGYTVLVAFVTTMATIPLTMKNPRFDPLRELPPVIGLVEGRQVVVSSSALPWTTFQQFVAWGKQNPGKVNWGSPTANTRLVTESLLRGVGLDTVYIPYSGGAQYLQALVTGDLHIGFTTESGVANFGTRFRPLGVTGASRAAKFPDVPTFIELGQPQVPALNVALYVRAGTPTAIINRLHAAASSVLKNPESRERYAKVGFSPVDEDPVTANKRLQAEATLYAEIAKKAKIEPQ